MNWRTDKPTANVIVAYVWMSPAKEASNPCILRLAKKPYEHYYDDKFFEVPYGCIEKWADLEEDETVTENNSLKEEVISYFQGYWPETETAEQCNTDMHFTPLAIMRLAEHFAKWGAEHTFTHHETDESLQEAVTHQMEDEQVIDDYVRKGLDEVCLRYAELGAKWGAEHLKK